MTFDLEKARDLAKNPIHCFETDEIFADAITEIERLRAEMENYGDDYVCQMKSKDARIKELEKMMYSAIGQIAWSLSIETGRMPDKMSIDFLDWQVPPEVKKTWTDWAALHLQSEGKIGPDTSKPRSWQITDERKAAIWHAVNALEEDDLPEDPDSDPIWDEEIAVLRAMLRESQ